MGIAKTEAGRGGERMSSHHYEKRFALPAGTANNDNDFPHSAPEMDSRVSKRLVRTSFPSCGGQSDLFVRIASSPKEGKQQGTCIIFYRPCAVRIIRNSIR